MLSKVAAVVVHHRSYDSVAGVVDALLSQGIASQNILVVDNSEEPNNSSGLRQSINSSVEIAYAPNLGYAAAVNHAVRHFSNAAEVPEYFLVSTHEVRPSEGALAHLHRELEQNPRAAVAGPTLISGSQELYVWSTGGYIDSLTGVPAHHDHKEDLGILDGSTSPVRRSWLDGAFLLYRWMDISERLVPEEYFLYMEETDLHLSLRKSGREVLWVPQARVWQESGGIPPFYFARNIRILLRKHGGLIRSFAVPPLIVARRIGADLVRRRGLDRARDYLRGLVAPIPSAGMTPQRIMSVHIINPLGAALLHYERELTSVLHEAGCIVSSARFLEPSASRESPFRWLAKYVKALVNARLSIDKQSNIVIVWPVLGYLDIVLVGLLGFRNVAVILHDPQPLVRSVGYSEMAKRFASLFRSRVEIIAHSLQARAAIDLGDHEFIVPVLPHPILRPSAEIGMRLNPLPVIRVLGQYKADRDLQALRSLSQELSLSAVFEVHGRGWPAITGWTVFEGFVEEGELDVLISESAAVLIPYKRFFQSGIAVRALEAGTPFVGPRESVLAEMLGNESKLLVDPEAKDGWNRAVTYAINEGADAARRAAEGWRRKNIQEWSAWVEAISWGAGSKSERRSGGASET